MKYLFGCERPVRLLELATEAAITETVAALSIDSVITTGKTMLAVAVAQRLQELADRYGLGVQIHSVNITDVSPPAEVADAFTEAARARSDRERLQLEAERYRAETLAKAKAEAKAIINRAIAEHDKAIDAADSEAARFMALWTEYSYAPAIAATKMYLETLAEVIPRFKSKLYIDRGTGLDVTIMREEQQQ